MIMKVMIQDQVQIMRIIYYDIKIMNRFNVLKFIDRGGSYHNYYMYYGGNHYGRWAGNGITNWYADGIMIHADMMLNEV